MEKIIKDSEVIRGLMDEIRNDRDVRISNLNHAVRLLRMCCIATESIAKKTTDDERYKDLEALHGVITTMRNVMESELDREVNKANSTNKGDDKQTVH